MQLFYPNAEMAVSLFHRYLPSGDQSVEQRIHTGSKLGTSAVQYSDTNAQPALKSSLSGVTATLVSYQPPHLIPASGNFFFVRFFESDSRISTSHV